MVYLSIPLNTADLQLAIVRAPLTIGPEASVTEAIATMSGGHTSCTTQASSGPSVNLSVGNDLHYNADLHQSMRSSCVVVLEGEQVIGILTERDVVRLSAQEMALDQVRVRDVMAHPVVTLQEAEFTDIFSAITLLQQKRIRHLPLLDEGDRLVGLLTHESLQRLTRPIDLLRFRMVQEVMTAEVVQATPETSMLAIAQQMAKHRVSSVVIVEAATASSTPTGKESDRETLPPTTTIPAERPTHIPVGIITERDLVQFQALGLSLGTHRVSTVMSTPIFTVRPEESLWTAQQLMEHHCIQRVVVVGEGGRLAGIITQTSVLQALNPLAIYKLAETLEIRVQQLEAEKLTLQQASTHAQLQLELASRRQTEGQLRASEQRYASLVAASPVGILRTDCRGICTYANERYCQIVGLAPELLIGQHWSTGHYPDDIRRIEAEYEQSVRDHRPCHIEYRLQGPDGQVTWVYGQAVAEWDPTGQQIGFVGTVTDISDRKTTESLLASQNHILERITKGEPLPTILDTLLQTMEAHLPGSVCTITLCQDGRLGAVTAPSLPADYAAAVAEADLPIAEGVGSCGTAAFRRELVVVTNINHDPLWRDYKSLVLGYGLQACTSIPIFGSDRTLLGVFGIYYHEQKAPQPQELTWISQAANIAGIAIERDRATQALQQLNQELEYRVEQRTTELQESNRFIQKIATASPNIIYVHDIQETRNIYINREITETLGYTPDEVRMMGSSVLEHLMHPEDFRQLDAHFHRISTAQDGDVLEIEYRMQHVNGEWHWLISRDTIFRRNPRGEVEQIIGTAQDITARKQAELALREHEQFLQTVLDTFPLSVFWKDVNSVYLGCNQNFLHDAGLQSVEQIIGKTDYELPWGETEAELYRADDRAVIESQTAKLRIEEPQHTAGGQVMWLETNKLPLRNLQGEVIGVLGTYQDISDRKAAEKALILKQSHLAALLNNIPHIAWIKDEQSRFIAVNHPFAQACGVPAADLVGKTDYDIWPADLAQAYRDDDAEVLQSGLRKVVEEHVALADGTLGWLETTKTPFRDDQQAIAGTVGIAADITDRKTMELALRASERRYASLAAAAPVAIFRFDTPLHCVYVNERWSQMCGRPAEAALGYGWMDGLHPDDRQPNTTEWAEAYTQANPEYPIIISGESRNLRPDGTITWCYVQIAQEFDDDGNVVGYIGTLTDITDRKQAEQKLQELSERLELAVQSAQLGIWEFDYSNNRLSWDERMLSIYGISPEAFQHTYDDWSRRVHLDDLVQAQPIVSKEQMTYDTEFRIIRPDGTVRWIMCSSFQQRNPQGELVRGVGINRDITDRKQAELALEESRQKYYTLIQSVNGIVWDYDLESNKFIFVSKKAEALLGYPIEQWLNEADFWRNHVYADDLAEADRQFQLALQERRDYELDYRMVAADGRLVWFSDISSIHFGADGSPLSVTGILIDMSDRRQAEIDRNQAELALQQEALRRSTVFNASPDGIHILNRAGDLLEANESFARMLGYSLPEALELNVCDWDAQWTPEELQDILQTYSYTHWTFETLHRRKDGSVFPVEISECAMEWNGEFALVCISRDISERKKAAQQLELTNAELLRATRLKDEFLANMSHELRTPLNAILGMTEVLQEEFLGPINDRQRQSLKTIERSGSHLLELINDILDVAKIEAGQFTLDYAPTAIASLCQASLTFVRQQAQKKRIQLNSQIPPNLPLLDLDERRIRQVLLNLLNNAVKFTPEGGSITLTVIFPASPPPCSEPSTPEPSIPSTQWLRISVSDTGIGIAPEHISRLFQPFIQIDSALNRQYDGTGLGLALVKRIIELHGGQVGLRSEVGVGSCFSIDLPYQPSIPSLLPPNPSTPTSHNPGATTTPPHGIEPTPPLVLIVEDNEANLGTLSSYLDALGYRLVCANNGEEAITYATSPSERPDLILMDIQMPGMDGLEAIRLLRQDPDLSAIPIIALTALAMEGDRDRCLAAGATEYLSKPLKLKQLSLLIQQCLPSNNA